MNASSSFSFAIAHERFQSISADTIVLELLNATKGFVTESLFDLSAKQLIHVAKYLGLTEAAMRMALSRQSKNGKLVRKSGRYSLSKRSRTYSLPRFWLDFAKRTVPWKQDWFLVSLLDTKISATEQRRLQRKADLMGLSWQSGLGWIRPNNLASLTEEVTDNFKREIDSERFFLGVLSDTSDNWQQRLVSAWPTSELNGFYQEALSTMAEEKTLLPGLTQEQILVRSYTIGRLLVERLSIDPWLPEPFVDTDLRQQVVDAGKDYYKLIMPAWLDVLNQMS